MKIKMIEIRDNGTCIAAMAIQMVASDDDYVYDIERRFLKREGYPDDGSSVTLMRLSDQKATNDPYQWPAITRDARTMPRAHDWIIRNWDTVVSGQVVDVRVVMGESKLPDAPEISKEADYSRRASL